MNKLTSVLLLNAGDVVQWQTPRHFIGQHEVPEPLKAVVSACLEYKPDQRPSMDSVVTCLEHILKTL